MLICIMLALVIFAAYEGVRKNDFVYYDDDTYVTENPSVQKGLNLESIRWAFTSLYQANWHPLTWLSHIIDCAVFGMKPAGHHLVSVGFHIANTLLLLLILRKMTGAFWPSVFVSAVFGLHPLGVDSVAWVSQRKNLLSAFFGILTIAAYFRYAQKPGLRRYLIVVFFFAAGLSSKPMLVTLPFCLMLLDFWPLGRFAKIKGLRWFRASVSEKTPLLVMSAASCVITYIAQARAEAVAYFTLLPLGLRVSNALISYVNYIGKIFYPSSLAVLYPLNIRMPAFWKTGSCLLLLAAISVTAIGLRRRFGYLFTGWFWFLGTLVPVIGLIQVGLQSMADRYVYWPGIGIYIIVAWLTGDLREKFRIPKPVLTIGATAALVILFMLTRQQVRYWKNSMTIYERTLAVTENNYRIETNYGELLRKAGRLDESAEHFKRAIAAHPRLARAYHNLGIVYSEKGLFAEATAAFERALEFEPNSTSAHNYYAICLAEQGAYDKAVEHFSRALTPGKHFSGVLKNLCNAAVMAKNPGAAMKVIADWLQKIPDNADLYYQAGILYEDKGDVSAAIESFEKALELAESQNRRELADEIKRRLEKYHK
ncbi:MAG: tetratricopeptide repeat protein [Sedimentisphaerales bacterium]|nr:tetratricopeptide repeat protein [Sedimentisphaerales bacterium]